MVLKKMQRGTRDLASLWGMASNICSTLHHLTAAPSWLAWEPQPFHVPCLICRSVLDDPRTLKSTIRLQRKSRAVWIPPVYTRGLAVTGLWLFSHPLDLRRQLRKLLTRQEAVVLLPLGTNVVWYLLLSVAQWWHLW